LFDPKVAYSSSTTSYLVVLEYQLNANSQTYIMLGLQITYFGILGQYQYENFRC